MEPARWAAGRNVLMFAALVAVIACVAGYIQDPTRFFRSYMVAFAYTAAIGLGAFFFVMVQYLQRFGVERHGAAHHGKHHGDAAVRRAVVHPVALGLKDIYSWTNATLVAHERC